MFQTTARSSRVATVYMTQNLPNYYDAFGADSGGRDRAKKLLEPSASRSSTPTAT